MKKIKAVCTALMVLFTAVFVTSALPISAKADSIPPYYYLSGSYDSSEKIYTINVYLYSDVVLDVGTFGLKFSDTIAAKEKSYTTYLPTANLYSETGITWADETHTDLGGNYISDYVARNINDIFVYSWNASDMYVSDGSNIPYKIYMGKLEVKDVEMSELSTLSFTVLDWTTTSMYGNYYDAEIWREGYAEEKAAGIDGYYQGQAHITSDEVDSWNWVDIGLYADDLNLDEEQEKKLTVKGRISGYNPNFRFIVYFYQEGEDVTQSTPIYTFDSSDLKYSGKVTSDDHGWATWDMELDGISLNYKYQMVIKKTAHITYPTITVDPSTAPTDTLTLTVGDIPLICGDLDGNGVIKLRDRVMLMRMLNRQTTYTLTGDSVENLDGICGVNMVDLAIMRKNFETNYDPATVVTAAVPEGGGGGT